MAPLGLYSISLPQCLHLTRIILNRPLLSLLELGLPRPSLLEDNRNCSYNELMQPESHRGAKRPQLVKLKV